MAMMIQDIVLWES